METFLWIMHLVSALAVIGLVLLQHGKGADMGAGFGSGASGSLFGASGSANFLSRSTAVLAAVFFVTSLGLTYLLNNKSKAETGVMSGSSQPAREIPPPPPLESSAPDSKAPDIPK